MAVESHIHSLKAQHEELDIQIKELMSTSAIDDIKLTDLKRRKLKLKDRISKLSEQSLN